MSDRLHNLLTDATVSMAARGRGVSLQTLPGVMSALARGEDVEFPALQPHQRHAWHAFLVQLGAASLVGFDGDGIPGEAAFWRERLTALAGGDADAWTLVRSDLSRPALFQPPVPEGSLDAFKTLVETPDALDILLTAKNFDVKTARAQAANPEHWLFALVTRQTMDGFGGRGNYGIARMNGGFGNRPCLAAAADTRWSTRFRRDTLVWLEQREALMDTYRYSARHPVLLWLLPWSGDEALDRTELDPFFIEVCRRIRLVYCGESIVAQIGNSAKARINLSNHQGDTGDIWTPVGLDGKALTLPVSGFHYRRLHELLFSADWRRTPAREVREGDGDTPVIIAQALVRGQGKTEGYHERVIPIPKRARGFFADSSGRLGKRSEQQITRTKDAAVKVLKPALLCLLQGGPEAREINRKDERARPWLSRFDQRVDERFFSELFGLIEQDSDEADAQWKLVLAELARATFEEAIEEMPIPLARRLRAIAVAQQVFFGARKRVLGVSGFTGSSQGTEVGRDGS